jgi:uncharacterized protein (DUF427 family)
MTMAQPQRIAPLAGQESVWDYPRPPRMEPATRHVRVEFGGEVVAESDRAVRVLETAGAPTYYMPPEDVRLDLLRPVPGKTTFCEWKGTASYYDVVVGDRVAGRAVWTYPSPADDYAGLAGYLAFYPARLDEIRLDDEVVRPQPGRYYGGWVTDDIVGPFKGEPGTEGW